MNWRKSRRHSPTSLQPLAETRHQAEQQQRRIDRLTALQERLAAQAKLQEVWEEKATATQNEQKKLKQQQDELVSLADAGERLHQLKTEAERTEEKKQKLAGLNRQLVDYRTISDQLQQKQEEYMAAERKRNAARAIIRIRIRHFWMRRRESWRRIWRKDAPARSAELRTILSLQWCLRMCRIRRQ